MKKRQLISLLALSASLGTVTKAASIAVANHSFEDTSGQTVFNEFTFGSPTGWDRYDPNNIIPNSGVFDGTLLPNGTDFFNTTAPDGDRVAILFNSGNEGDGEYGMVQTLAETLSANTTYTLEVEVGNITSGFATNGTFFDLSEFPGYRVELLAGGVVIAMDDNGLTIPEGEFSTSTVTFTTGFSHALLGQDIGIRLVNENEIPAGFTQMTSPDLEVDFDNVRLTTTAAPEPSSVMLGAIGMLSLLRRRRG